MPFWPFKSNYSLIAENTTKYYLELENGYNNHFQNRAILLATSGVIDAQNYIFKGNKPAITIPEILEMAQETQKGGKDYKPLRKLFEFSNVHNDFKKGKTSFADMIGHEENISNEIPDDLYDFIFNLEVKIFVADNRNISPHQIQEACKDKWKTIEKAILNTMHKYLVGNGSYHEVTLKFMNSEYFEQARKHLGIESEL